MVEIHCCACDWTDDNDDPNILAEDALQHHNEMGIEQTVTGPQHRHVYFEDEQNEPYVTCQSGKIIYLKDQTNRPLRGTSNLGSE